MIKYKIIENFIDEDQCNQLVNDAEKILNLNSEKEVLNNNRQLIPSTSITHNNFISNSKNWSRLNEKLYSNDFYLECLNHLNLKRPDSQFLAVQYLYNEIEQSVIELFYFEGVRI